MWKIFFTYRDKSKCTVTGKGTITPGLATEMKTAVLQAETLLDRMQGEGE